MWGVIETRNASLSEGALVIKNGAEGQSRTDTGSPLPVLSLVRFVQRLHHETYSLIGFLIVLAVMVCLIKDVGQAS